MDGLGSHGASLGRAQRRRAYRLRHIVRTLLVPLVCLLAAFGLAACGGDDDGDGQGPDEVVRDYLVAATQGDEAEACGYLTEPAQRAITQQSGANDCEAAFQRLAAQVSAPAKEKAKTTRLTTQESGNTAKVTYEQPAGGGQNTITLTKQDGDWKISDPSSSR